MRAIAVLLLLCVAAPAAAAPEPSGPHPRIVLDDTLRKRWKQLAKDKDSWTAKAVKRCDDLGKNPKQYSRDLYMGLDWSQHLQACLVAWAATDKDAHAKTALKYFTALIDDLDVVGDGKGGDDAGKRDSGFAIRAMGPYTALAYDWLHDHPGMTEELRARARKRWKAWTDWYLDHGYRPRSPGTNYHAGYLLAATLIAIAQGNEAGRVGASFWDHVSETLWGKDMAKAFAPGGVLDGGDWGEGWQYGPLAVMSYAFAARAMKEQGVEIEGVDRWLEALMKRNVHGLTPGDEVFVGGDTSVEPAHAHLKPELNAFAAPLVGDASPEVWAWAKSEIAELGLTSDGFPLYPALAEARDVEPKPVPRDVWPTAYLSAGISTFYARSNWGRDAVWMVTQCSKTVDVDHMHANAGNVVLSRGRDDVIVDPSPYGTLSSLTGNAPTVESAHLPEEYKPSQAWWSEKTGFRWARQTRSGIVAARCDYADQYKFQHRPSDVPEAVRDLILIPYGKGDAGTLVVIDRARSGAKDRELYLRFKTEASLKLDGDVATGKVGGTQLTIRRVGSSSGAPKVTSQKADNHGCMHEGSTRGGCEDARIDVDVYKLTVDGPAMYAMHVLDAAAPAKTPPAVEEIAGVDGVALSRDGRTAVIVAGTGKDLSYAAPKSDATYHVIAGAPNTGGKATISATASGDTCQVKVSASGSGTAVDARPVVVVLDASCAVAEDPSLVQPLAAIGGGDRGGDAGVGGTSGGDGSDGGDGTGTGGGHGGGGGTVAPRSGCCGAQATPGSAASLTVVVLFGLVAILRRRR